MRRNGDIYKIEKESLISGAKHGDLKAKKVNLPISDFYEDKSQVNEIGLKWMYLKDMVQIKLQHCLLHYDLDDEKEVSCLNNYQGVFDNP